MKKIIGKKEYDTESAVMLHKYTFGVFGEPSGYEETLYKTVDGYYFVYTFGGPESKHTKENITRIAKANVDAWISMHR